MYYVYTAAICQKSSRRKWNCIVKHKKRKFVRMHQANKWHCDGIQNERDNEYQVNIERRAQWHRRLSRFIVYWIGLECLNRIKYNGESILRPECVHSVHSVLDSLFSHQTQSGVPHIHKHVYNTWSRFEEIIQREIKGRDRDEEAKTCHYHHFTYVFATHHSVPTKCGDACTFADAISP